MFKFRRWVCLALVCAMVGVAYGAARKIRSFTPYAPESVDADGMAILNLSSGNNFGSDVKTILQLVLSDFTPNTTYHIGLIPPGVSPFPDGNGQVPGAGIGAPITTDEHGNATSHGDGGGDITSWNIAIYLPFEIPQLDGSRLVAYELRALGNP